jgi:diguanylate cyclase (GGDEF)-like protein
MTLSNITKRPAKPILSIRARLVILALLAVVPLMIDRVRLLETSRAERIEAAAAEAMALARRGADGNHEIVTTMRALLQAAGRTYALSDKTADCATYFRDFAGDIPWIKSLSVVDASGRIRCSSSPTAVGLDVSDRAYFRDAMKSGGFALSDYLMSRSRTEPTVIGASAVKGPDGAPAVIIAPIDLQWIARLNATAAERHSGTTVMLLDADGTVLARHPDPNQWVGKNVAGHPLAQAISARPEGTFAMEGLDGTRRIFAFLRVPSSTARLVVGLDESDLLGRADREISMAYVQVGFFGLLVLLIAWFGGERLIVDPIRKLARTAARIGRGEHDVRLDDEVWAKEFESLATALHETARKLAERERELRAANRHFEELASIDSLSALANRRGFDARLEAEWRRAQKQKLPIGLVMVDVDHFKLFNDCYGHVEGDNCLRSVGELLACVATGPDDFPARYGGEEFALLLPGADAEKALEVAERLRWAVEALYIVHGEAPAGVVTVSIGVASLIPDEGERAERLVEAADAGLYAAKRSGRNSVVTYSPVTLAA